MAASASDVPDVLACDLACVFCGINPGRVSAAAHAHFANPRNDFWRLLHDAGFTPRQLAPAEQFELLSLGYGVTNAAYRTTPGSGDLRRGDFDRMRLEEMASRLRPRVLAFVGKEAYRGVFVERAELGPQARMLAGASLYVLPSTSPANAAVPYEERLRWFSSLRRWIEVEQREAVRALVLDGLGRVLLLRWQNDAGLWWITPGGGLEPDEDGSEGLRRELAEETGLVDVEPGPLVYERTHRVPWGERLVEQHERIFLVRIRGRDVEVAPTVDLAAENVTGHRWWTLAELEGTSERVSPPNLAELAAENLHS